MRRSLFFIAPALLFFALSAQAESIFVYSLSTSGNARGGANGTITILGNDGDTMPLLDSATVLSFHFVVDGFVPYDSARPSMQILSDSLTFDGTLGATTLHGTAGDWEMFDGPEANTPLDLMGQVDHGVFNSRWKDCNFGTDACLDFGSGWALTLQSETVVAPEPSTKWFGFDALGAFAIFHKRRLFAV
ncbi:MAG TPA: hypothetical protein VGM43_24935 [Bryobacteraceae bacterium]